MSVDGFLCCCCCSVVIRYVEKIKNAVFYFLLLSTAEINWSITLDTHTRHSDYNAPETIHNFTIFLKAKMYKNKNSKIRFQTLLFGRLVQSAKSTSIFLLFSLLPVFFQTEKRGTLDKLFSALCFLSAFLHIETLKLLQKTGACVCVLITSRERETRASKEEEDLSSVVSFSLLLLLLLLSNFLTN